ncbi:MAG: diadenylate cyclase CdaA [Planctomycetota bacterium]|nr:diadenylate cyclase CdaA [Planctomycetota bacterium]
MEVVQEWLFSNWRAVAEVTVLALSIYVLLRFIQQARGHSILRGLLLVGIAYFVTLYFASKWLELSNINWIMDRFIPLFLVTILVVFQPEVRHALLRIGHDNRFSQIFAKKRSQLIKTLVNSAFKLSSRKFGALIALEREDSLDRYADGGEKIHAVVSPDMLLSVFYPGSPLHDGAVIISDQKIKSAGCLFPLSESTDISSDLGTRHRAGIGLTEETDAVVIIVSEETSKVSIAVRGHLTFDVKMETLESILNELYTEEDDSKEVPLDVSKES